MQMELNNEIYVMVIATPTDHNKFKDTPAGKTLFSHPRLQVDIVFNNKTGLSELYNKKMKEYEGKKILFIHDDVEIHDKFLIEKLDKAFLMYDVVGLAGGLDFHANAKQLMWHTASTKRSGIVSHYFGDNRWNSNFYGFTPSRTVTLDGLFLAVDSQKCKDNNVEFDEDFDFHYYDISFCLRANEKKLKLGTYPVFVVHHGLGNIDDLNHFEKLEREFYDKYCK